MSCLAKSLSVLCLIAASLSATPASAQTLTVASGEVRRGQTIDLPVHFTAGGGVVGLELHVVYDPSRFGTPTCFPLRGTSCAVHHAQGRISLMNVSWMLDPLATGDYAVLRFPVDPLAPRGTTLLGGYGFELANSAGNRVRGTLHTGQIRIR
jgi:hypothetical protein